MSPAEYRCPKCEGPCRGVMLPHAAEIAEGIRSVLAPHCEKIVIAGSIRRYTGLEMERWDQIVHDVEIVALPLIERTAIDVDLFGEAHYEETDLLHEFVFQRIGGRMFSAGRMFSMRQDKNGRNAVGRRYKRLWTRGLPLDLFAVLPPAQFGVILAIRTGPASFSKKLVTKKSEGGFLPDWMKIEDGRLMRYDQDDHEQPGARKWFALTTPGEEDVFEAIGLPYIRPEDRT